MDVLKRMACAGIVPVVVLEDAKDAVPTAKAMVAGGIAPEKIEGKIPFAGVLLKKDKDLQTLRKALR